MSIAAALPLIDAAFACKHFALTATDHILHYISTDWADKLLDLFTMLFYDIVCRESFSAAADFVLYDALDLGAYIRHEFYCAFLCLCHLFSYRSYAYPSE